MKYICQFIIVSVKMESYVNVLQSHVIKWIQISFFEYPAAECLLNLKSDSFPQSDLLINYVIKAFSLYW